MSRVSRSALILHHLRTRPAAGMLVAGLVAVLAALLALVPVLISTLGDQTLDDRLRGLAPTERDVVSTTAGLPQIGPGGPWDLFLDELERVRVGADEPLPGVLGTAQVFARTGDMTLPEDATRAVAIAYAPGVGDRIVIAEGRMPEPAVDATSVEIVLSVGSAAEAGWTVGDSRTIPSAFGITSYVLTGVFEAADVDADYWQHVTSVLDPRIDDDGNRPRFVAVTALAHPSSLAVADPFSAASSTRAWYPLDAAALSADQADAAVAALRRLTAVSHTVAVAADGAGILGVRFESDTAQTIESALAQEAATLGVIAMIAAGPAGVAAAVLVLSCRVVLQGRAAALRLVAARGASGGQIVGLLVLEGVLIGLLPAAAGGAAVLAAAGSTDILRSAPAAFPGLVAIGILAALGPSVIEQAGRSDLAARGGRARLIGEAVIVLLAAAALVLLLARGYSSGPDPLLATAPLLLVLAACLLTLRLYPIPLRWALARARARPSAASYLGAARALREPSIGVVPVLALIVGVSVAVSSGVLLSTLQGGITEAARAQVGADLRIVGAAFTRDQVDRVREIEGVAAATGISTADPATLDASGERIGTSVFVIDAADLREVQGDGPGMLPPGVDLAATDGRMPVVVSGTTESRIDGRQDLSIGGVDAEVVGTTYGPVPTGARANWIAIDASYAPEVLGRDPSDRTLLLRLDDGTTGDAVESALRAVLGETVRIDASADLVAAAENGPAAQGVRWALYGATALSALLGAYALVLTLALAAPPRARILALLRTLGASPRGSRSLAAWEVGPPLAAAAVAGTLFGAALPWVVLAAIDLRPFTGSSLPPGFRVDPLVLGVTLGVFAVLAVVSAVIALAISRRVRAAGALRTTEEG